MLVQADAVAFGEPDQSLVFAVGNSNRHRCRDPFSIDRPRGLVHHFSLMAVPNKTQLQSLFQRCKDDPFDEPARREYESLLRSELSDHPEVRHPGWPEVRYLELDRQLYDSVEEPDRFSQLLIALDAYRAQRLDHSHHRNDIVDDVSRRYALWLDSFAPNLTNAVSQMLRLRCEPSIDLDLVNTPILLAQGIAVQLYRRRSAMLSFICRFERKPDREGEMHRDELQLTIRPGKRGA
jgi:hypothetical protein